MGQADRPLKIGGVKIGGGQKTVFGDDNSDDEDEDEDESEDGGSSDSQVEASNEKVLEPVVAEKPGNKRKRDEAAAATVQEGSKIKLKELIAQFLQEVRKQTSMCSSIVNFFERVAFSSIFVILTKNFVLCGYYRY